MSQPRLSGETELREVERDGDLFSSDELAMLEDFSRRPHERRARREARQLDERRLSHGRDTAREAAGREANLYASRAFRPYDSGRTRIDAEGVRTVKIRGQATPPRRRPAVPVTRYDQHPDRAAQWALFLGVFMVVVAIVTGS